jgi:hypothetical protein
MVLSTREKYIAIAVGVVFGGLLINSVLISPLLAKNDDLKTQIANEKAAYERDMLIVRAKTRNEETWRKHLQAIRRDKSAAESQIIGTILAWAEQAGMGQPGVKPNPAEQPVIKLGGRITDKDKTFLKLTARFTGSGSMRQVGQFLWQVQTSGIPVRISDMSVSTRKENTDDLELALGISTIFLSPEGAKDNPDRSIAGNPGTNPNRDNQQGGRNFMGDQGGNRGGRGGNPNNGGNNPQGADNSTNERRQNRIEATGAGSTTAPATNASEARQ